MAEAMIEQVESAAVAFVEMHGPYAQMPTAFGTLYGWVAAHGLVPEGMPRGVFLTAPDTTPEDAAVWELWVALAGDPGDVAMDAAHCGVKHVPAHTEAWILHKGPYDSIAPTYDALGGWVAEHGYVVTGAPMEVYLSDPAVTAPADYLTEIRFPVRML